ncbi:MAG: iron-sulfur cluster insertion protein ErpA [Methyloligellaceae bacterium]
MSVTVSLRAADRISEIVAGEKSATMLRVSVEGGGCTGFQYKFDLVDDKSDDDLVINQGEATILVDSVSLDFMAGSEIDYVEDLIGASFKVNNPNAVAACGCGTSFTI